MKTITLGFALLFITTTAFADFSNELGDFIGYTIVGNKTIIDWYDKNGKSDDSFEGCDFDRVFVFSDNRILTCASYGYTYAYRPRAVILSNGYNFKMIVGDHIFSMYR